MHEKIKSCNLNPSFLQITMRIISGAEGIVFLEAAGEIVDSSACMTLFFIFLESMSAGCCSSCLHWRILVELISEKLVYQITCRYVP
jgi:hypothetical protein